MDQVDRLRAALADRYELDREIGSGGMAQVYLARDRQHDRDVAIKVLRPELAAAIGTERFLREIRIEARLQHPNILPLYDSGTAAGLLYYVMPYVEGETLRERIRREKQLPLADALQITREVAEALSYAHAHDVVHRDIKPANILLSGTHALVADFGIAKAISEADADALTGTGIAIGTPEYMSPEQGSGDHGVDRRSDIYALGCVLYEMLAGQPPFTGRTAQSVLARHRHDTPSSLRVVRPALPPGIEQVVEKALAKVPADRYATAVEFSQALDTPSGSRPGVPPERPRAPKSRRAALAGALAILLGLTIGRHYLGRPPAVDPDKVMVFPLIEHGQLAGGGAGEAVGIMIGSAFEHTEPLKWIDGWTWLEPKQREDLRSLSRQAARKLSLRHGARFFLEGSILRNGDSATVILQLNDAIGDSLLARASASGGPDEASLPQVGLRAAVELLPALVQPGRGVDRSILTRLLSRRPAALANWLQGEREYRRSRFDAALTHFRRAVEVDSELGVAAVRGAAAASWLERGDEATALVEAALARESSLPAKYAELAHGLRSYFTGSADSAVRHFRRALAVDSTWSLGWMSLGEVYFHLLPSGLRADSLAEAAFAEARREDPVFAPALYHLTELAVWKHDLSAAEALRQEFDALGPDSARALQLELMLDCPRHGRAGRDWRAVAQAQPLVVLLAAKTLSGAAAYPDCAMEGFRAVLAADSAGQDERWGAVLGLQSLLVARGRYAEAVAVLDSAVASGLPAAVALFIVDAAAGAPLDARAREVVSGLAGDYRTMSAARLWYLGIWAAHRGDSAKVVALAAALQAKARESGDAEDSLRAKAMAARLAVLDADTTRAVDLLRELTPRASKVDLLWGDWQPLAAERLLLAQLLLKRGESKEALEIADGFDQPQPVLHLLYLPASLALRMEAAQALGLRTRMVQYRDRLVALGRLDFVHSVP